MVNHGAAALLLIMSLLVAVALFGADARPSVLNDVRGQGFVTTQATVTAPAVAATPAAFHEAEPTCTDCDDHSPPKCEDKECEDPPPKCEDKECAEPPPACDTCEHPPPEPKELTCKKVHGVKEGETCESVAQCAGLGQDDFLGFNPNLDCCKIFVGQWVCLETGCDECDD